MLIIISFWQYWNWSTGIKFHLLRIILNNDIYNDFFFVLMGVNNGQFGFSLSHSVITYSAFSTYCTLDNFFLVSVKILPECSGFGVLDFDALSHVQILSVFESNVLLKCPYCLQEWHWLFLWKQESGSWLHLPHRKHSFLLVVNSMV